MGWSDDFLISEKACDGSGKVVEEWTRCCCGRYKIYSGEQGVLVNDTLHEPFGIAGNFCGPDIKHRIRDIENQYTAISERHQRLVEAAKDLLNAIGLCGDEYSCFSTCSLANECDEDSGNECLWVARLRAALDGEG